MKSCQHYREQMLEALHGLLDEPEETALAQHLLECPACEKALRQAEEQKRLLATAARFDYPALAFAPPEEKDEPAVIPLTHPKPRPVRAVRWHWSRWAVAACILLLVGGIAAFGPEVWERQAQLQRQLELAQADYSRLVDKQNALGADHWNKRARADKEHTAACEKLTALENELSVELSKAEQKVKAKQLNVSVTGQDSVQPGAPNDYHIETRDWNNELVSARLDARVLDGKSKKLVYEEKNVESDGKYRLNLPRDLQVRPGSELVLEVAARREDGPRVELTERLALARTLYVTHLATDKPMYQPGETVHFRSLTLERFSLRPAAEEMRLVFTLANPNGEVVFQQQRLARLTDEKGKELQGPDQKPIKGIGVGQFPLPEELKGGEYTLTVSEANNRFLPERRRFLVNQYEKPRLNKELEYTQKSYGPGDSVTAICKFAKAQGGLPLVGQPVVATIQIDGKQYDAQGKDAPGATLALNTDALGVVSVRFRLPRQIERGEATLAVRIDDGGSVDTIVRPIPVVLKKLFVEFYPEGGDLVAGVPNRVYFQARTTLGKPAELKGRIVGPDGKTIVQVHTLNDAEQPGVNQGMGRFDLTPQAGGNYELKIDSPAGVEGDYRLPNVTDGGVAMSVPTGLTTEREPIRVVVHSAERDRNLLVGAYCRGRLLDHRRVTAKKQQPAEVQLRPEGGIGGVYRVTVFEERSGQENRQELVPVAERLVYRQSAGRLNLAAKADKPVYSPGEKVTLRLSGTQEQGEAASAILLVAVVDKSVVTLADEKTARTMPTHFLLTHEVRKPEELEYADFLVSDHPKASEALDLLLGTQGWRRFAEQDPGNFRQQHKQEAERLLVSIGQGRQKTTNFAEEEGRKVIEQFRPKLEQEEAHRLKAAAELEALEEDADYTAQTAALGKQVQAASAAYTSAAGDLSAYQEESRQFQGRFLLALSALLLAGGVVCLVIGFVRSLARAMPYFVTGVGSLAACGLLLVVSFALQQRLEAPGEAREAADAPQLEAPQLGLLQWKRDGGIGGIPGGAAMPLEEDARPAPQAGFEVDDDTKAAGKGLPKQDAKGGEKGPADLDKATAKKEKQQADEAAEQQRERAALRRNDADGQAPAENKKLLEELRKEIKEVDRLARLQMFRGTGLADRPDMEFAARQPNAPPAGLFAPRPAIQPPPPSAVVRVYAHQRALKSATSGNAETGYREDDAETVFWHPVVVLADGQAQVSFQLCDSVTSFQVTVFGHTLDGRLGAASAVLESRLPFAIEPKLPIEVTASDQLEIPLAIANESEQERIVNVQVQAKGLNLLTGSGMERLTLGANLRDRRTFRFQPNIIEGTAELAFRGISEPFAADSVRRFIRVVPDGFPIVRSHSDMLEKVARHEVVLPPEWLKGTLKLQATVYPSTLAELQKGLEGLLQEPNGCFEQTSTSNYPNLLILDYLQESDQADPKIARQARALLERGYQKLTAFECQNTQKNSREGYEWFGGVAPPHEALTAYGLLQFRDMARVYKVDSAMLERTRSYLLARRDGKGGFERNQAAIDSFGRAPADLTNAYIVWALTESGKEDDVTKELKSLEEQAKDSKDPYFLALVANSLLNRDRADAAHEVLKKLVAAQKKEGYLDGARTSITSSGGRDLQIETTSLALLAWLKCNRPEFLANVQSAVKWLGQQRGGQGSFGSTQSTILALKALIAYTRANKKTPEAGELSLFVNDRPVQKLAFPKGAAEALVLNLPDAEKHLQPGKNEVRIEITGNNAFPATLAWSYRTLTPVSAEKAPVHIATKLDRDKAMEGETVRLTVQVENKSGQGQGMAVAIVGLPGGLTISEDMKQLKDLTRLRDNDTKPGAISAFETRGRELILYWRDLGPDQKIEVNVDLICRVPGEYRGPASRAYLYYNADHKHWITPLEIAIAARP